MFIDMQESYATTVKTIDDEDSDDFDDVCSTSRSDGTSSVRSFGSSPSMDMDAKGKSKNGFVDDPPATASMADNERANKSLCDLPYGVTLELMRSMDTDKGWEALAAQADFTFDRIQRLALKQLQADGSPTRTLLWELGCLSYTVSHLYEKLKLANRLREMKILEQYVKAGGQEGKAVGKKDSPLLVSLPSLLNQIKVAGKENHPQGQGESGFSSSGSEINFNHLSPLQSKSKAKVGGIKNYDDKVIPGTESLAPGSPLAGASPHSLSGISKTSDSFSRRISASAAGSMLGKPHHAEAKDGQGPRSLPSSLSSSLASAHARSALSPSLGADRIKSMLENQSFPSSPNSACSALQQNSNTNNSLQSQIQSSPQKSHMDLPASMATPQKQEAKNLSSMTSEKGVDLAMSVKTVFNYNELVQATDNFADHNLLGEGAFGKVYKGTLRHLDCAIKRLNVGTSDGIDKSSQVKNELATLLRYQHENIVTLYGYALDGPALCMVYQHLQNGSLEDRILQKNGTPALAWERRVNILMGACKGLNFLHTVGDNPLIHGDIKSANILLDQYLEAKIGDLGQAQYATGQSKETSGFTHITIAEKATKQFGTKAFMSPDIIGGGQLSIKSDVYAMGVVFLEVCSGMPAYDQDRVKGPFLAEYYKQNVKECPETEWPALFRDKHLNCVSDSVFIDVMRLADKCVRQVKKQRPDSVKLVNEIKSIYRKYREAHGNDSDLSSLASSLQMDSQDSSCYQSVKGSNSSLSQSVKGSERSCYQSHGSEGVLAGELTAAAPVPYTSVHQQGVQQLQEERWKQFHSLKSGNAQPQLQPLQVQHPSQQQTSAQQQQQQQQQQEMMDSMSSHTSETVELRKFPTSEPESPILKSLEAFKLQQAYDTQPEKKRVDRLSGLVVQGDQEEPVEEYPSDPQKLKKIDEFDQGVENHDYFQQVSEPSEQLEDVFPKSDPKKLAELTGYDEGYLGGRSVTDTTNSVTLECDPKKMAYLQNFDDAAYNNPKLSPQKVFTPSTYTDNFVSPHPTGQFTQAPTSGQLPTSETSPQYMGYNVGMNGCLTNIPVTDASHNGQFLNYNVCNDEYLSRRRSSNDNNMPDGSETEVVNDDNEEEQQVAQTDDNPFKFLSDYAMMKYALEQEDGDDEINDDSVATQEGRFYK